MAQHCEYSLMPDVTSFLKAPSLPIFALVSPSVEGVTESHKIQQMMEGYLIALALASGTLELMVVGGDTVPRCSVGMLGQCDLWH